MFAKTGMPSKENYMLDQIKRIKLFLRDIKSTGYTIADILDNGNIDTLIGKRLFFSMAIEYKNELTFFNTNENKWVSCEFLDTSEENGNRYKYKYNQIEKKFSEQILDSKERVGWCRCIGGIQEKLGKGTEEDSPLYVYYYISVNNTDIDLMFFHCAEKVYYEWIAERLAVKLNAVTETENVFWGDHDVTVAALRYRITEVFRTYMRSTFEIDIETITALSGIYYEGDSCRSNLVFLLSDVDKKVISNGITLSTEVEIKVQNIKRIRKLLQMGTQEQFLLVCKKNGIWKVKGLYNRNTLTDKYVAFQIRGHMVWSMVVNNKLAVGYKCGQYIIESEKFELVKLENAYSRVFRQEPNEAIKMVFSEAIHQKHGTILIIIKNDGKKTSNVEREVRRLIKQSAGMKIKNKILEKEFVISLTSIDGALIIDENGLCYGFGMILDGKVSVRGEPERGARFNSTRRYIKACQKKEMTAIGLVISEDKMIDIFSTDDDFSEVNRNAGK